MDKRFASVIGDVVHNDPLVVDLARQQKVIEDRYGQDDLRTVADEDLIAVLAVQHADACQEIQQREEEFWSQVKPGRAFLHRRYITGDRVPERCVVTKLEYCRHGEIFQVYYRTANGAGMRTKADPLYFRTQSFGEWA